MSNQSFSLFHIHLILLEHEWILQKIQKRNQYWCGEGYDKHIMVDL